VGRLRNGLAAALLKALDIVKPAQLGYSLPWLRRATKGASDDELIERYRSWVYTCANKNAVTAAQVPLRAYVKGGTRRWPTKRVEYRQKQHFAQQFGRKDAGDIEEIEEHPILDLLAKVNPWRNSFDLLELIFLYEGLVGNSYVYKLRGRLGVPEELWVLPSQWVEIKPDKQKFIAGYWYGRSLESRQFIPAADMIHFLLPDPASLFYGTSPLRAVLGVVDVHQDLLDYGTALLENYGRPDFAVVIKGRLSDDQRKALHNELRQTFSGSHAGSAAVLDDMQDIKPLGFTPRDMSWLGDRKLTMEEIAGAFGVPLSKLKTDDVNRSNAEAGNYSYMHDTISPLLKRVEQKLNEQLCPDFDPGRRLFLAFDDCVPENREYLLEELRVHLTTGYASINEKREHDGLDPVDGGDVPLVPNNMVPLGSQGEPDSTPPPEDGTPPSRAYKAQRLAPSAAQAAQPATDDIETALKGIVARDFESQRREVQANIAAMSQDEKGTGPLIEETEIWLFGRSKWNRLLGEHCNSTLKGAIMRGGDYAANILAMGVSFEVNRPELQAWLGKYVFEFARRVNDKTHDDLKATLSEGLMAGEHAKALQSRVAGVFEDYARYRTERIARTEAIRALNAGQEQLWRQSGVVSHVRWITSGDACEFCREMANRTVMLGTTFWSEGQQMNVQLDSGGEGRMQFSYSDVSYPPLHPNCRCAVEAVLA